MTRIHLILAFCAAPLLAQMPGGPGPGGPGGPGPMMGQGPAGAAIELNRWWESPIVNDLKLSAEQQNQIRTVVREYRSKLIDLRAGVQKAEGDVQEFFNDDPFDQRKTAEAIDRLVTARGELTRAMSQMSLRLRAVLSGEQWKELQKRRPRMATRGMEKAGPQQFRNEQRPRRQMQGAPAQPQGAGQQQPPPPVQQ